MGKALVYRVGRHIEVSSCRGYLSFDGVVVDWAFAKRFGGRVFFGK